MPESTYTHKDLARQLKVSETTIKSYRRKFPNCIPVSSQGKPIRFTAEALGVCRKIRDLFYRGMSVEEVRSRLAAEFSWIEDAPVKNGNSYTAPGVGVGVEQDGALGVSGGNDEVSGAITLPPGFANAISGLAKSVVALTRQQGEILDRLCSLENNLQEAHLIKTRIDGPEDEAGPEGERQEIYGSSCPDWAGDIAERLKGVEETLMRTMESVEANFSSFQFSDNPVDHLIPPVHGQLGSPFQMPQMAAAEEVGRVLPWRAQAGGGAFSLAGHAQQTNRASEEYLRHISTLPLVVQVGGDYTGLGGRGPFCLNDLKAILAQTFSPPNHFVGRWETASGELWYMLEQPEEADSESISLHLRPVETRRNQPMLEVARLMVGGVNEHPSSLYTLVQQLLG